MIKFLRRHFGLTAYTFGNSKFNGHSKTATTNQMIQPIESLRGQIAKIVFSPVHAAAVTTNGKLFTWGDKNYGKLGLSGIDKETNVPSPQEVTFFSKNGIIVKDVVLAKHHTIVLDSKGRVYSFGQGRWSTSMLANLLFTQYVALGHPKAEHVTKPKQIAKLEGIDISQISTGNHFSLALGRDGRLMVWGRGEFGVLGCGNKQMAEPTENEIIKTILDGQNTKIKKIKSCQDFSSFLTEDGTLFSFGNNDEGVMGIGRGVGVDLCEVVNNPTPLEFPGQPTERVQDFELGETSSAILSSSGKVYQMGQRLFFHPELINLDFAKHPVRSIAAFSKGVGIVTSDNEIFTKGAFWPKSDQIDEDPKTGVSRINFGDLFEGKKIVEIGYRFSEVGYVLVDESVTVPVPPQSADPIESPTSQFDQNKNKA